ncbi:class I SAM-dependent methyltransferase [Proteinivorax hydrogeniformans]|uniref:Class I SAM-dependent methyltransferase n=1 Tax=Proteinivorax hydrogeniformans TaxID=1826727 RepID=A0AAU8HQJ1_9FIRM
MTNLLIGNETLDYCSSAIIHQKTIDYYNQRAEEFSSETLNIDFENQRNMFLKNLKSGAHILDLGCGAGRDSKAFLEKCYKVTAMDGSKKMCEIASKNIGQRVICKNFHELDEKDKFDDIWANASLLHVPSVELYDIFKKLSLALKSGGCLYVSFKYGEFEGVRDSCDGRYFTDFTEENLRWMLSSFSELNFLEIKTTRDLRANKEGEKWLNAVIKKN